MAQTIQIKRSNSTSAPSTLAAGELAYSDTSDKLWIGAPADSAVISIGGKYYTDLLGHTPGTLNESGTPTFGSAILVDSSGKVNKFKTENITIDANSITSGSGDINLVAAANLDIDAGTLDFTTQATEFSIKDDEANSLTIKEGNNKYLTLVTTNSSEKVVVDKPVTFGLDGTPGFTLPTSDGSNLQALVTNGSGVVTWQNVTTALAISGDSGTANISGETASFTISGTDAIDTSASGSTLAISIKDATDSQKGAASFSSSYFTVTSGNVTINDASDSQKGAASFSSSYFTVTSGNVTINDASDSQKGAASFNSTNFTVTSGNVTSDAFTIGTTSLNLGGSTTVLAGLTQVDIDNVQILDNTISTTDTNGNLLLSPNGNGVVEVPSGYKDRSNFSGNANALVTKGYVDAVKQALDIKDSVKVATTANLGYTYNNSAGTLTAGSVGAVSLDGVALDTVGQRVLVKNETTAAQNGIYEVTTVGDVSTAIVLTRSEDANVASELTGGTFVFVEEGTAGGNNGFVFTHDGEPTLGTTSLPVAQFSGAGQVIAGTGLTKTGNEINVGSSPSIQTQADSIEIRGITTTAIGDLLIGAASDAGYTRLVKPSSSATASDYILSMNSSGVASWGNVLDGGTF